MARRTESERLAAKPKRTSTGSRPRVLQKEFDRAVLKYLRNGEFYELAVHTWRASLSNIVIEHIISDNDEIQYFSNFPSFKK